jgi:putative effector of murein hydrolase LrgA (UPF0299 family)
MKTKSLLRPAVLLALLFAAGSAVAALLDLPVPAPVVGLAFVALALRVGVMFASARAPAPARRQPALARAA